MLTRLVVQSLVRGRRRKALAVASVAIGVGAASGLFALVTHLGDIVQEDLRRYGANISVRPKTTEVPLRFGGVTLGAGSARLSESDLSGIRENFWKHNILSFTPYLHAAVRDRRTGRAFVLAGTWFERELGEEAEAIVAGVRSVSPWWKVEGEWIRDEGEEAEVILGSRLAAALGVGIGDDVGIERDGKAMSMDVVGIVRTGGPEEEQAFTRLGIVQDLIDEEGAVSEVVVSALTMPEPKDLEPFDRMTPEEQERFLCSPYPQNVAETIEQAVRGARAEPIAAVVRVEGDLLRKMESISIGMGIVAVVAAVLGVLASMSQSIGARRPEMALMQVLGARRSQVFWQLALEGAVIGLLGGGTGFLLGVGLALSGEALLGVPLGVPLAVLPLVLIVSVLVVCAGTIPHAARALRAWPVRVLRAEGA